MKLLDEVEQLNSDLKAVFYSEPLGIGNCFFVNAGAKQLHQNLGLTVDFLFKTDHARKTNFFDVKLLNFEENFFFDLVRLLLPFFCRVDL
jgi:hypothetical protein